MKTALIVGAVALAAFAAYRLLSPDGSTTTAPPLGGTVAQYVGAAVPALSPLSAADKKRIIAGCKAKPSLCVPGSKNYTRLQQAMS